MYTRLKHRSRRISNSSTRVEFADLHRELVVDDDDFAARDQDVVDVRSIGSVESLSSSNTLPGCIATTSRSDISVWPSTARDLERDVVNEVEIGLARRGRRGSGSAASARTAAGLARRRRRGAATTSASGAGRQRRRRRRLWRERPWASSPRQSDAVEVDRHRRLETRRRHRAPSERRERRQPESADASLTTVGVDAFRGEPSCLGSRSAIAVAIWATVSATIDSCIGVHLGVVRRGAEHHLDHVCRCRPLRNRVTNGHAGRRHLGERRDVRPRSTSNRAVGAARRGRAGRSARPRQRAETRRPPQRTSRRRSCLRIVLCQYSSSSTIGVDYLHGRPGRCLSPG